MTFCEINSTFHNIGACIGFLFVVGCLKTNHSTYTGNSGSNHFYEFAFMEDNKKIRK